MALSGTLTSLGVVALLFLIAVFFGLRVVAWLRLQPRSLLEEIVYAAGLSFAALEVAVFALGMSWGVSRVTLFLLLGGMALAAGRTWLRVRELYAHAVDSLRRLIPTGADLALLLAMAVLLGFDALLAMAPLTGSDALNYHFVAPLLEVNRRFAPEFWLTNSFLTGQSHLLILVGLTLRNEQVALGLIDLGGILAAASLFLLSRELMRPRWAMAATLTFLATPLVYWQMSTSGAPDIWMAFYTTLAVFAAWRAVAGGGGRFALLAGLFAGAAAGTKYTGWAVVGCLALILIVEMRSLKFGLVAVAASFLTGIYPLVRNALWTGDPVFPFLAPRLLAHNVNRTMMASFLSDTGASLARFSLSEILAYPFVAVLRGEEHGMGHLLGPVVLAFAPLVALGFRRRQRLARLAALLWAGVFLSNVFSSQMARFLLPVYPVALAMVFAGASAAAEKHWRIVNLGCVATLAAFWCFAGASYALYARDFVPVSLGLEKKESFLARMAPDYQVTQFVNRALAGKSGHVMVFFRHLYYLKVPFLDGDPGSTWPMNPERYSDPGELRKLLVQQQVKWVVDYPRYPEALAPAFRALENEGWLQPAASGTVQTFSGFRVYKARSEYPIVILRLEKEKP